METESIEARDEVSAVEPASGAGSISERIVSELLDAPEHLARCEQCDAGARYRGSKTGASFIIEERYGVDHDVSFGIGPNGIPCCPNDHGEMTIADEDGIPVAEAFQQVRQALDDEPLQRSLPGITPTFNYAGAWTEVAAKTRERARLKADEDDAHEEYKRAKKDREKCDEVILKMIDEYDRHRREKVDPELSAQGPRCRWEALNPGQTCPICSDEVRRAASTVAADSEAHGVEARDVQLALDRDALLDRLAAQQIFLTDDEAKALIADDALGGVLTWLDHAEAGERGALPTGLGRPHIVPDWVQLPDDAPNACSICGGLFTDPKRYPAGALVGVDCPGPEPEHRYPSKGKKRGRKQKPAPAAV